MGKLIEKHPMTIGRWIDPSPLEELQPSVFETPNIFETPLDPWEEGYEPGPAKTTLDLMNDAEHYLAERHLRSKKDQAGESLGTEGGLLTSEGAILLGNVVSCTGCVFRLDPRPWWKKLLFKAEAKVFRCMVDVRPDVVNPVTGEKNYTDSIFSTPSKGMTSPFGRCADKNLYGFCDDFRDPS